MSDRDWTFNGAPTRELTHCYHDYPARMIPQIARRLLDTYAVGAESLFDPYCGTGTSLVEGMIRGLNVAGTDLNPLARLIAQAKISRPDPNQLDEQIAKFRRFASRSKPARLPAAFRVEGISRLDFWFKPSVIGKLLRIREFIGGIKNDRVRLFFQVAFSETVRESSNTRNHEFKLYRYDAGALRVFRPRVFELMMSKLARNRDGLQKFLEAMRGADNSLSAKVYDFNTACGAPPELIPPASVDIVVTSPPYGDSHTTVAYGQYSRLSAAWLGLREPDKIDRKLMGGKIAKQFGDFPCEALNNALLEINHKDGKRALEVAAYYSDLHDSIFHVSQVIRPGGHACYVVGNRKVKGVVLPTDEAIQSFFERAGFEHVATFRRSIPNKHMPLKNSPTNAAGVVDTTMAREHIVVLRRQP